LRKRLDAEDVELLENNVIELVIRDLVLDYIRKSAIRDQKYYMRSTLFLGRNVSVQIFVERLNELKRYLIYFPEENPKQLDQEEIIKTLDQSGMQPW
jgi:hypothetical protein